MTNPFRMMGDTRFWTGVKTSGVILRDMAKTEWKAENKTGRALLGAGVVGGGVAGYAKDRQENPWHKRIGSVVLHGIPSAVATGAAMRIGSKVAPFLGRTPNQGKMAAIGVVAGRFGLRAAKRKIDSALYGEPGRQQSAGPFYDDPYRHR